MALWHDMHAGMYVWLVLGVSELGGGGGGGGGRAVSDRVGSKGNGAVGGGGRGRSGSC